MTGGGPNYATYFFGLNIYFTAFKSLRFAYASTLAWMLFAIIAALTIVVFTTSRRWVFYAGGTRGRIGRTPWRPKPSFTDHLLPP